MVGGGAFSGADSASVGLSGVLVTSAGPWTALGPRREGNGLTSTKDRIL